MSIGLEPLTKTGKWLQQKKFSRSVVSLRCNMLKRGYILGDKSPDSAERWMIFYDRETTRSVICERHAAEKGFKVVSLPEEDIS